MITGAIHSTTSADRQAGFKQALADAGREIDPSLIAEGDFSNFGDITTLLNPEIVDEIKEGKL